MALFAVGSWLCGGVPLHAAATHQLCDLAAETASRETSVPLAVLQAIARVESGIGHEAGFVPWPWTVNFAGSGQYFPDRRSAVQSVLTSLESGKRNIDIGCFQINLRWHGDAFANFSDIFDPELNALYAARYLSRLHQQLGSWPLAVGAYHSKRPEAALAYTARVEAMVLQTADSVAPAPEKPPVSFALLAPGAAGRLGSVLPTDIGQVGPILSAGAGLFP